MARHKSGYKVTVYIDDNPNSPTYGQTFEVREMDTTNCPVQGEDVRDLILTECEIGLSGYTGNRINIYWNETQQKYDEEVVADAECEPSPTGENWVNSGTPYCETTDRGINTGYMLQPQIQMNSNLSNYGEVRISRYKSNECESNDCAIWDEVQSQCHIDVYNCVPTFDGTEDVTQIDINPLSDTYNQTRTVNKEGSGCTNCTETTFTWEDVGTMCGDDAFLCSEGLQQTPMNLYTVTQKYKHINGSDIPMDEYHVELLSGDSVDCGYIPPMTAWTATSQYLCDYETYTKYQMEVLMISYDSGLTWSQVDGVDPRRGAVITEESYDCGKPMERWVSTNNYICVYDSVNSSKYLTLDIVGGGTIKWFNQVSQHNGKKISYSLDSGSTWIDLYSNNSGTAQINVQSGDKVMLKGNNLGYGDLQSAGPSFSGSTATFNIEGNIMSLIQGDDFVSGESVTMDSYAFAYLFQNTNVISAEHLIIPSLSDYSCYRLFYRCTRLTTPPSVLPNTTLVKGCYTMMFNGCTALETPPELPATTLADSCYAMMFSGCTSLGRAPYLKAATLEKGCYSQMFRGCSSLNYIKCLATNISASNCTSMWVYGVSATGTFVKAASMDDWSSASAASGIPNGWTVEDAS